MSLSHNIRHICFNHQQGKTVKKSKIKILDCFAVGNDDGVRIFNCDPLTELARLSRFSLKFYMKNLQKLKKSGV